MATCFAVALVASVRRSNVPYLAFQRASRSRCMPCGVRQTGRPRGISYRSNLQRAAALSMHPFDSTPIEYLELSDRNNDAYRIAYRCFAPSANSVARRNPNAVIVYLNGLMSTMSGTKTRELQQHASARGAGFLCFDYRGHGSSSKDFVDCTMHDWVEDAELMLDRALHFSNDCHAESTSAKDKTRVILVGSSMGAWIAMHLALNRQDPIAGIVGIGSAFDFTHHTYSKLTKDQQRILVESPAGERVAVNVSSPYLDEPYPFSRALYESGNDYLIRSNAAGTYDMHDTNVSQQTKLSCPVRLLHGVEDDVVHPSLVSDAADVFRNRCHGEDIAVQLINGGDHRLSRPEDIQRLLDTVDRLMMC